MLTVLTYYYYFYYYYSSSTPSFKSHAASRFCRPRFGGPPPAGFGPPPAPAASFFTLPLRFFAINATDSPASTASDGEAALPFNASAPIGEAALPLDAAAGGDFAACDDAGFGAGDIADLDLVDDDGAADADS